jgi:vacuolar protein sorting-associated protein VTA1
MALAIPPELKKMTQFIRRAEELDKDTTRPESRLVAYYCRQYAVHVGIPFANTPPAKKCLGELLNDLEVEKEAMSNFSRPEAEYLIRKFAQVVFDRADQEDRVGSATKNTARTFYAAATFYEVLQQFYEKPSPGAPEDSEDHLTEDQQEDVKKRKYSKWKATDILKAMKEGRNAVPGGYGEMEAVQEQMQNTAGTAETNNEFAPPAPSGGLDRGTGGGDVGYDIPIAPRASIQYNDMDLPIPMPMYTPPNPDEQGEEVSVVDYPPPLSPARSNINSRRSSAASPTPSPPSPPRSPPPSYNSVPSVASMVSSVTSALSGGVRSIVQPRTGKVSKSDIADAMELTRFALAALEENYAELGAQRLEEALGCLGKR